MYPLLLSEHEFFFKKHTYLGGRRISSCRIFSMFLLEDDLLEFGVGLTHEDTKSWVKDIERSIRAWRVSKSISSLSAMIEESKK